MLSPLAAMSSISRAATLVSPRYSARPSTIRFSASRAVTCVHQYYHSSSSPQQQELTRPCGSTVNPSPCSTPVRQFDSFTAFNLFHQHPSAPRIIGWMPDSTHSILDDMDDNNSNILECMNRNARIPKKANRGSRPNSRMARRKKMRKRNLAFPKSARRD